MSQAVDSYLDKWRQRCPELRLLPIFQPGVQGSRQFAWACMLAEWEEALFASSDAAVGRTKLLWWGEDLARGRAAAQHPLSRHLLELLDGDPMPAPPAWRQLAGAALPVLAHVSEVDPDLATQQARWLPFAEVLAGVESQLLGCTVTAATLSAQLRFDQLVRQLSREDAKACMLPSAMQTRFGDTSYWRSERSGPGWTALAAEWSPAERSEGCAWRRLRQRLQQRCWTRLRRGHGVVRASELGAGGLLWHSWRAAREAGGQATPHSHVQS